MRFGVAFANAGPLAEPGLAVASVQAIEAAGFDSIWTVEHVVVPAGYESTYPYDPSGKMPGGGLFDLPDPLIWLAYAAAVTDRIKLGTGIMILPQRNPAIAAKEVATLDQLSGGRVVLGVGAGWLAEEFDALGVPFEARGRRLDSYIETMRALWREPEATVQDDFVSFRSCISLPKPPQGQVPIVIGGHSEAAARRAGRLGDGFMPGRGDHDELARLVDVMRQAAEDAGRDPAGIELTVSGADLVGASDREAELDRLRQIGVSRVLIAPLAYDAASAPDAYASFAAEYMAEAS